MKSISIAMATYNGARFIREQLDSLAGQSVLPDEIVITDDGSTDGTLDIVRDFAAGAPFPVRVERNAERLGYRANFMKAAALCQSDLIAFCDQDDIWNPGKLECCRAAFSNKDVLLVYHNAVVVTETLEPISVMSFTAPPQMINPPLSLEPWKNAGWGFTTVIDKFLLKLNDLWPNSLDYFEIKEKEKHDSWFFFLASCLGSIAYLDGALALYRQHGNNVVGCQGPTKMRGNIAMLIANDMQGIKSREISAENRAFVLEEAVEKLKGKYRARATAAAAGYRMLEARYRTRMEVYQPNNVLSRSRRLMALTQSGGYLPRIQWGAGRQALVRDLIRGVIFPTRISRRMRLSGTYPRYTETAQSRGLANRPSQRQHRS